MKKVNILIDREPLSRGYVKSKQNFGKVLSQIKPLKPPVWKSTWFYGPVGLAVVALTVTAVNSLPPDRSIKTLKLEALLPLEQRKIEAETLAFVSLKEENTSFREITPEKSEPDEVKSMIQEHVPEKVQEHVKPEIIIEQPISNPIIVIEKSRPLTKFPSINRVYTGEISLTDLCSNGIECLDSKITSFSLEYYNGYDDVVEKIQGNSIDVAICEVISKFNLNEMIFITQIRATVNGGQTVTYPSMNLIPVKKKY